jgi:hypothetical protein
VDRNYLDNLMKTQDLLCAVTKKIRQTDKSPSIAAADHARWSQTDIEVYFKGLERSAGEAAESDNAP